jgi:transposase
LTRQEALHLYAEVHRLHRLGKNNSVIAESLGLRRATVIRWLKTSNHSDGRGWKQGRARKHADPLMAERICQIKKDRVEHKYLFGSEYVQMDYCQLYPDEEKPSIWYIDEVVRRAGLQTKKPKNKRRGGSIYLLYPVESMKRLGYIQQSADFIGKKYLSGPSRPVTIFSSCYYRPFKLYHIQRIPAERAAFAMEILMRLWSEYPTPHVFRMDNGGPFRGTGHSPRRLGTFVVFLLNLGIIPLFGSPSRPWTNPSIEGHNRVFTEKVWKTNRFDSVVDVDREADRFNAEGREFFLFRYKDLAHRYRSRRLTTSHKIQTQYLKTRRNKKINFIRFVGPSIDEPRDHITVMNQRIFLPEAYSHQFVFATWDLHHQQLRIVSEYQGTTKPVLSMPFKINE